MPTSEALLSAAYIRGRHDGNLRLSSALNPFPEGSAEAEQWRQGRDSAIADRLEPMTAWPFPSGVAR